MIKIVENPAKFQLRKALRQVPSRFWESMLLPKKNCWPKLNPSCIFFKLVTMGSRDDCLKAFLNAYLDDLLKYSGFPEPFVAHSGAFHKKWSREYLDRVIKEDIVLLTRIADREKLHDLYRLLPELVRSPLSENSVANHLESNPVTIKNYLKKLEDFYLAFRVIPYSKNIKRAILKAAKWYLYDWTTIKDPYSRFENFVAVQLYARISAWQDLTGTEFILSYIRDKNKNETDFVILKDRKPWLMIEAKYSDASVDAVPPHFGTAREIPHF